jgi:hypothetical protein
LISKNILVCKATKFYSHKDEDVFFEWLQNINCIDKYEGIGNELHLYIASDNLHDHDLRDLIALFIGTMSR